MPLDTAHSRSTSPVRRPGENRRYGLELAECDAEQRIVARLPLRGRLEDAFGEIGFRGRVAYSSGRRAAACSSTSRMVLGRVSGAKYGMIFSSPVCKCSVCKCSHDEPR